MMSFVSKILPSSVLLFLFVSVPNAFGQETKKPNAADLIQDGLTSTGQESGYSVIPLTSLIGNVIQALLGIVGVVFLLLTIYAGFLWMTAAGDPKKVDKAKQILGSSLTGLIIVVAAYAFTAYVVNALVTASKDTTPG